jgi:hypothetical protein
MFAVVSNCNKVNLVFPEEKDCILELVYARGYLSFASIFRQGMVFDGVIVLDLPAEEEATDHSFLLLSTGVFVV